MLRVERRPLYLSSAFVVSMSGSDVYPVEERSFKILAPSIHY